jgi:hypothetical protein
MSTSAARPGRIGSFFDSWAAVLIGGIWGAAEASFFFVVPDLWLGLVGLLAPRRAGAAFAATIAGAVVGAAVLFGVSRSAGAAVEAYQAALPGLSSDQLTRARTELADHGLGVMVGFPFQGYPLKVGVHEAAQLDVDLSQVAVFAILNRLARVGPFVLLTTVAGTVLTLWIHRREALVVTVYGTAWALFYGWYWLLRPT